MNTVLLTIDSGFHVLGIHPILERYFGVRAALGNNLLKETGKDKELDHLLNACVRLTREEKDTICIEFEFDSARLDLSVPFSRKMNFILSRTTADSEPLIIVFARFSKVIQEYSELLREKEQLHISSIKILNQISSRILNEPSSQKAASESLQQVATLFHSSFAVLRICLGSHANNYVAVGLPEDYLTDYNSVQINRIPTYLKMMEQKLPIIDENPQEGMGYLYSELQKHYSLEMVITVPIIEGERVIGFICLGFDKRIRVVQESRDILENVVNEFHFLLEKNDFYVAIIDRTEKLKKLNMDIVTSLSDAIEARDSYTNGHSERVAAYAVQIAQKLGWDEYETRRLSIAGLLHDIGKVGIPDAILLKPGPLSRNEKEIMKLHPELSSNIVSKIESFQDLLPWIRYHHEAVNGEGYPFGLVGKEIPSGARIISVADAFDAMTSNRPYRDALTHDQVEEILLEGVDKQWDREIVEAALASLSITSPDSGVHYNIPEKLDQFRRTIFHISSLTGLYLFEYIYSEAEHLAEAGSPFVLASISLKKVLSGFSSHNKKKIMDTLIELARTDLHYPILVARYDYHQLILLAPQMNMDIINKQLRKIKVGFFEKTDIFITTQVMSFPQDGHSATDIFDNLLKQKDLHE